MILHGKDILILDGDGKTLIAAAKSCDINVSVDTTEVSSPTTGMWKTYITKRKEWEVGISHLVLFDGFVPDMLKVGTTVQLQIAVSKKDGSSLFDGMVNSITDAGTLHTPPSAIYWCKNLHQFVYFLNGNFYAAIDYTGQDYAAWQSPVTGGAYYDEADNVQYIYNGSTLAKNTMTGTAIFKQAKVTGTRGSLASGTFRLLGSGELSAEGGESSAAL